MLQRRAKFGLKAANDNRGRLRREPVVRSNIIRFPRPRSGPFHLGARSLLVVAFAGLVLLALCGAFLLGLAAVGVLALAVAVFGLMRHPRRKRPPGALARQAMRHP